MDRFREMTAFCAVVEDRGFATAARRLGVSATAVSRLVAALEERIGAQLLVRATRSVRPTEVGAQFFRDCRSVLGDMEVAEELAAGARGRATGHVVLTAPLLFGDVVITPILLEHLRANASSSVRALFVDRVPDLYSEGIDLAVLMGPIRDAELVAAPVGTIRRVVCGAREYLANHEAPSAPAHLSTHRLVVSTADSANGEWVFQQNSTPIKINVTSRFWVSTNVAAIGLAAKGWGLTRVMSYQVNAAIREGTLVSVLDSYAPAAIPVHVVCRRERHGLAKVRHLMEHLVVRLREHPALTGSMAGRA